MEMAAYGKVHPGRLVRGILVFTTSKFDPKTDPWYELTKSDKNVLKVVYLDDFLDNLEKQSPDHPLVAVFKPWRIEDTDILRKNAKTWYQNIEKSKLDKHVRENFYSVFIRWMQERFKNLKYEEVLNMFVEMTPLEETVSYKEIFAKGMADGRTVGKIEGKTEGRLETISEELNRLELLKSQNVLNDSLFEITDRLGIKRDHIIFTDEKQKNPFLEDMDFLWHLDDDWNELRDMRKIDTIGVSVFGNPSWVNKCNRIITYHEKKYVCKMESVHLS